MKAEDNLVRMANQIGTFFASMPDRKEALEGIATHLKNFWDPRMRAAFLVLLDSADSHEVSAIVRQAVGEHRGLIAPHTAPKVPDAN
jgi:formate dehydrogenase subunit delta